METVYRKLRRHSPSFGQLFKGSCGIYVRKRPDVLIQRIEFSAPVIGTLIPKGFGYLLGIDRRQRQKYRSYPTVNAQLGQLANVVY